MEQLTFSKETHHFDERRVNNNATKGCSMFLDTLIIWKIIFLYHCPDFLLFLLLAVTYFAKRSILDV